MKAGFIGALVVLTLAAAVLAQTPPAVYSTGSMYIEPLAPSMPNSVTPASVTTMQKANEKVQQRLIFERDRQDQRRALKVV